MTSINLPGAAGGGSLEVDMSAFSESILAALALHGLQQKVADKVSGAKKAEMTEADALAACLAVIESLKAGTWAQHGGGGPRATNETDFIIGRLVAEIRADAKKAKASPPTDEAATATALAIMASTKDGAVAKVAKYRAEWNAKGVSIKDLI